MPGIQGGRVCVFGAGGPVGAMVATALAPDYTLRLGDVRDIHDILEAGDPRDRRHPRPSVPEPPHEWRTVDVRDYTQVLAATEGMDALINLTVLRHELADAFRVNLVGAYNVMKAAVACGVRRVIHTGPRHTRLGVEGDYWPDFDIPDGVPLHSGSNLYALTKQLGGEVVRVFAEQHGIEALCFLFTGFRYADGGRAADGSGVSPLTVSWEETGEVFRYGLRAPALPNPYEVFSITARLPHGKYSPDRAERLLGWKPRDNFERLYRRKA